MVISIPNLRPQVKDVDDKMMKAGPKEGWQEPSRDKTDASDSFSNKMPILYLSQQVENRLAFE
jgi:hypothetical protein